MVDLQDPNLLLATAPRPVSISDFPEDVLLCVLSFLTPSDISTFAFASKTHLCLCLSDAKLWFAMCERRWGSLTQIKKWGAGKISYRLLYRTLEEWEKLIGFWRRSGQGSPAAIEGAFDLPPLVFFEWGPSFVAGSRVSPSSSGTYEVIKAPFLWMGLSSLGEVVNFLHPDCRIDLSADFVNSAELGFSEGDLVQVNVGFMGGNHVVVEEKNSFAYSFSSEQRRNRLLSSFSSGSLQGEDVSVSEDVISSANGSPGTMQDRLMSDIYQYFANRTSPGGVRRQRKKVKERQGRRKWEPEHFVKIVNCSPTPSRPLQGLWKGICDEKSLDFYLVVYDDVGGIACRRVGDSSKPFSSYSPVFWTSSTTFVEPPFSPEEEYLYESRIRLDQVAAVNRTHCRSYSKECKDVSRILDINSSYDLVIPDMAGTANHRNVEGRIWQYGNGTFGFGFLRDNIIVDLKHVAEDHRLLDAVES